MVVASFFLVTRAVQLLATAALLLARAPALVITGWNMLVKTFKLILYQFDKVRSAGKVTQATMDGLAKRTHFFKLALDLLGKGLGIIIAGLYGLYEAGKGVLEWLGIIGDKAGASADDWAKFDAATAEYEKNREENAKRAEKAVTDSMSKEINALQKMVGAYKAANGEANKKFELDTKMLGVGEDLQLKMTERLSAETRYLADINRLVEEYQEKSMSSSESDQRMLPLIQKALQDVTSAYEQQIAVVEQLTDARIAAQTIENARVFAIRQETDALSKLADIQYEIANVTMSAQEKKYKDITYQAQKAAEVAIREEEIRRGSLLTDAEKQRYRDSAIKSTEKLIAKERELTAKSRDFSTGWKKAFNEYVDNATNAARQAEQIFGKAMQGIEDLIVNFAKTGKFEWKNFVNMMAEELLRSQVQQLMGSILGGLDSVFGGGGRGGQSKGGSANNPLYVYQVNGGGGIPGIPGMGGSSGGGSGGGGIGGVVSGVWDTVKSIGSSIGDLFGGFFANGGTLGAGKWGIAGENGPELISGPANITPMGGNTSVTYNINAVDARSFQQLLAQNPQFVYAVTEQGRKSIPGGR
jgi:phage-related minor tail protein